MEVSQFNPLSRSTGSLLWWSMRTKTTSRDILNGGQGQRDPYTSLAKVLNRNWIPVIITIEHQTMKNVVLVLEFPLVEEQGEDRSAWIPRHLSFTTLSSSPYKSG